jgi:uncharacterized protein YfbU (UPF0304 family)
MQTKQTFWSARRSSVIVLATILGLLGIALWQRQAIYDQIQLYGYDAPAEISQLATDTNMNDYARKIFYVNKPDQQEKTAFTNSCTVHAEQTIVLGCYKSGQRGIYLLKVTNPELKGIEQVTAAHEMLHAAYDRLSESERDRINSLLNAYYREHKDDEAIKQVLEDYKQADQHDLVNEMHSIFGTQIADLPAELNAHYAKFFTDRQKVVSYYASYEQAFTSRRDQVKQYDAQLNAWNEEIRTLSSSVEDAQKNLQSQRQTMNRLQSQGQIERYNSMVDTFNTEVRVYNQNVRRLQSLTNDYNATVEKRNAIAFEERALVESLSAQPL